MIHQARFEHAARLLVEKQAAERLISLWKDSTMSERMGIMLTVERVLEIKRSALDSIVHELAGILRSDDASLRGDTADLLGKIGHPDALEGLKPLLDDPNPDVAEIAMEAIEEIGNSDTEGA